MLDMEEERSPDDAKPMMMRTFNIERVRATWPDLGSIYKSIQKMIVNVGSTSSWMYVSYLFDDFPRSLACLYLVDYFKLFFVCPLKEVVRLFHWLVQSLSYGKSHGNFTFMSILERD